MSTTTVVWTLAAVTVAAIVLTGAVWAYQRAARSLRYRIAREHAEGYRKRRRRAVNLVGRFKDTSALVLPADTMPGYVWFYWSRKPRQPLEEQYGWAPFKWVARRQLQRAQDAESRSPRR